MLNTDNLLYTLLIVPGILLGFTFHEYFHALVAYKLGDNTPKFQGRLTFNPLAHIDIIGFFMILIFKFGWAKPVQVNPNAFKNYYRDDLKVSVAGVIGNLFAALLSALILALILIAKVQSSDIGQILITICFFSIQMNCLLFALNLLPLPGFDGFHILMDLFPKAFYNIAGRLQRFQFLILLIFIAPIFNNNSLINILIDGPVSVLTNVFLNLTNALTNLI